MMNIPAVITQQQHFSRLQHVLTQGMRPHFTESGVYNQYSNLKSIFYGLLPYSINCDLCSAVVNNLYTITPTT